MRTYIIAVAIAFAVTFAGCSKKETETGALEKKGPVIATIGDSTIIADDFKDYLSERPLSKRQQVSKEALVKRLDELVTGEVLYQEALRLKLDQDPEMRKSIRQMLTQKLMETQINRPVWEREIKESEFQEYYDRQGFKFNRPELVRLADIYIAVPPDASTETRAVLKKKAEAALAEALEGRDKRSVFGPLIRKYSDTHEKYRKGDTGFFDSEGRPAGIDKKLAEAAFRLEKNGSIHEQVIETADGYHIAMRIGKQAPFHKPLASVRNQIKQEIKRDELRKTRMDYIEGLKGKTPVVIDENQLAEIIRETAVKKESIAMKKSKSTGHSGFPSNLPERK